MSTDHTEMVAYVPGESHIVDTLDSDLQGTYSQKTIVQLAEEYPKVIACTWGAAMKGIENANSARFLTPPEEITKEKYYYWLEELPPLGFTGRAFAFQEFQTGRWTRHVCMLPNGRCFSGIHEYTSPSVRAFVDECEAIGHALPSVAWQVVGHYLTLRPEDCNSHTFSDGAIFAGKAAAENYARANMHPGASIKRVDNPTHLNELS